jgi:thiol-disulfide isomerase/thioredoxin
MKLTILWLTLALALTLSVPANAQDQTPAKKSDAVKADEPDAERELQLAIERSGGSPQRVMENLDAYLKKFPDSPRRAAIERELFKISLEQRDRNRAITYAERLVAHNERDLETLTTLVSLLRERRGEGDLTKALSYADQLVKQVETILAGNKPARMSQAQWADRKGRSLASVYLLRGQVQADLNQNDKAQTELLKSYQSARLAPAALALAELAEKRKAVDEAIDYYTQAFVLAIDARDGVDRDEVRRKLGKLYTAKHNSEAGLGDRLLRAYDEYVKEREARREKLESNLNAGVTDPFLFKLSRLDGSAIKLADYRGKVIVINFWATWCGPCQVEMPLFEKTIAKYKDEKDVVFLALNTDEDRELVRLFLKDKKYNLPIAYAENLDQHYGVEAIPTTLIFDRQGQVSYRQAGFNPNGDFVALLSEKIEEAKKR